MKRCLVFDGACLGEAAHSGVERSFLLTLAAFVRVCPWHPVLFVPGRARLGPLPGLEVRRIPKMPTALWRQSLLPRELSRRNAVGLLSPTTALPAQSPCASIATVHELAFLRGRMEKGALASLRQERAVEALASRASLVIVPSRSTERQLCTLMPALQDRVRRIPQPLHPEFLARKDREGPRKGLTFIGLARKRKNLDRILAAYSQIPAALRQEHPLSWVGGETQVEKHSRLPEGVVLLPSLSTPQLAQQLASSRAVLLPSLSEGFGLPCLEAAACGTPSLATRGSVTAELLPRLALFVDPWSVEEISRGMRTLLLSDTLLNRASTEGPALASAFHPERSARAWIECIEEAERSRSIEREA